ncbi:Protein OSB2, chloroplastic [Glycine soja]
MGMGASLLQSTKLGSNQWAETQPFCPKPITNFPVPLSIRAVERTKTRERKMVLEQAVSSSSTLRNVFTNPKTLISKSQFQVAASPSWKPQQPRWEGWLGINLKCSVTTTTTPSSYPKPSEIPWQKELCNSVNLIGNVAAPVEIKYLPSGKVVAWTRLYVKKSATQSSPINLTFWDDLAHVASQHLQKGHQIHVSGRLITDTVETEEGKSQTYYKVVVQQLNFIERNFSSVSSSQGQEFDFAMAGSGRKVSNAANSTGSVVETWNAFFANPGEWWDNRNNKRNPKAPDFKHKDTGEALWIEGRYNPPWVKSQLEILDSRMGSFASQNARMPVGMVAADEIVSF